MTQAPTKLTTLLGEYENTRALKLGQLASPLVTFEFDPVKTSNRAFKRVVRDGAFDVAELAIVTFLQAKAAGKPLVLMPAVIGEGRFQHQCLVYNANRGQIRPSDLAGKRVGIRAYGQTTVTWVRGILSDDYGVDLNSIKWVTFEDGHVAEFPDPAGVERAPAGKTLMDMLRDGELDAGIIGSDLPDDAWLQPVIPEPFAAAKAWAAKNQAFSINHMMSVSTELSQNRPDLVREIYRLLKESKRLAGHSQGGMDTTPFGVEANRNNLELAIRYSHEQGLIPRRLSVDELFDDVTRAL